MSQTFTLVNTSSVLSEYYYPPVELNNQHGKYCLGLTGIHTYNTIPNIETNINDTFTFDNKIVVIPEGSYEIADIEKYLQKILCTNADELDTAAVDNILSIKANNNTLKVEIKSKYKISFTEKSTVGRLLGFSLGRILQPNQLHTSDLPVEIIKVSTVRVECNIITGTFYGNQLSHTLFEFSPNVEPGFAINIEPRNIIYLPLNVRVIENITIRLVDQDGNLVNFRGEKIIVRLELKPF